MGTSGAGQGGVNPLQSQPHTDYAKTLDKTHKIQLPEDYKE